MSRSMSNRPKETHCDDEARDGSGPFDPVAVIPSARLCRQSPRRELREFLWIEFAERRRLPGNHPGPRRQTTHHVCSIQVLTIKTSSGASGVVASAGTNASATRKWLVSCRSSSSRTRTVRAPKSRFHLASFGDLRSLAVLRRAARCCSRSAGATRIHLNRPQRGLSLG